MKFLLITKGFPSLESEDAVQKIYLFIERFYHKHDFNMIIINLPEYYNLYKTEKLRNKDEVDFIKKFPKINIDKVIIPNIDNIFFKILKKIRLIFSTNLFSFYDNRLLNKKISEIIDKRSPDKIIVFWDIESVISCIHKLKEKPSLKIIQFTGAMPHETSDIMLNNSLRDNQNYFFKIYNYAKYKFLIFKLKFFFIKLCNSISLNIFFDTNSDLKKMKIKNFENFGQYSQDFGGKNWLLKRKNTKNILYLNAGMTTANVNATYNLIKYIIPHLQYMKSKDSKIFDNFIVAGVENELTNKIKSLNINWIVFPGWIDQISDAFLNSMCMIVPSDCFFGSRTKIFHALSCGLPVVTHESNIRFHNNLINKKNILRANNFDEMKILITQLLEGKLDIKKLSLNARITFEDNYDYQKTSILDRIIQRIEDS